MSGPEFLHLQSGLIQVSDEQVCEVNRSERGCLAVQSGGGEVRGP